MSESGKLNLDLVKAALAAFSLNEAELAVYYVMCGPL